MPVLIIFLLGLSLFFSIYVFIGMILILGIGGLLAYKNPELYKNKLKSYLINGTIVLTSIVAVIIMIEIYLHLAQPSFLDIYYRVEGSINDYKFQGCLDEKSFNKPDSVFRILGLGDSFAVSDYPLKKNYHNYLSAFLKSAGYKNIEVLNAGIPGTGPGYYWHMLEKFGDKWKPDLVLVGFFVGNDFEEFNFIMHRGPYIQEPWDPVQRWLRYLSFRHLWVYRVVRGKLIVAREQWRRAREKKIPKAAKAGTFSNQSYLEIEKSRMWIFEKVNQPKLAELWHRDAHLLLKFKEWCAQRKIPLVIAIFPDQFQVDRKLRQEIYRTYHLRATDFDLTYANGLIRDYCRQHQLHCLDMLGPFRKLGASQALYKLRDSHWNEAGNRLAADLISKYLIEHRLLEPRKREAAVKPGGKNYHHYAPARRGNL